MDIHHVPPTAIASVRTTTAIQDGDVGPQSPFYRRNRKKGKQPQKSEEQDQSPNVPSSNFHIDIRV